MTHTLKVDNIWKGYLLALLATTIATLLRWPLSSLLGDTAQYTLFYFSVAMSAAVAGWKAGVLASILGAGSGFFFFIYLPGRFQPHRPQDYVQLGLCLFTMGLITALGEWGHRRQKRMQQALAFTKENEQALLDAELRLGHSRRLLEGAESLSHTGAWEWDIVADRWSFSKEWLAIHGCRGSSLTAEQLLSIAHPEDRALIAQAFEAVSKGVAPYDIEHRIIRQEDGSERVIHARGQFVRDPSGKVIKVYGFAQDITERKQAEQALRQSEQQVRQKLHSVLSPEGDLGNLDLADLIDVPAIQALMEDWYKVTSIPMSLIDIKGKLVVGVGWQEICMRFHREHPETCAFCIESDTQLTTGVAPGEFKLYKCKNNMWDISTPLLIGDRHLGNLFSGQFFFEDEPLNYELFRSQARQYGFDKQQYLAALEKVPRLSREKINQGMAFLSKLAQLISQLSYSTLKLARALAQRDALTESLQKAKTELEHYNQDLEKMVQERTAKLEETVGELEHFSYTITHDMRAPLRAMQGFGHMLLDECSDCLQPQRREFLRRIVESAGRMDSLITDALNYSKIVRQEFDLEPIHVAGLLQGMIDSYPQFQPPKAEVKIDGPIPLVLGNEAGLTQCFSNLLGNVVKFVHQDKVPTVRVWAETRGEFVRLWVEDNGIGIAKEYHDKIFVMFQRLSKSYEGTGIGLALVRKAVERMQGKVGLESQPGQGSRFWLELKRCS